MNHDEQTEALEKYLQGMSEAVRINRRNLIYSWPKYKTDHYLNEHYPEHGTPLEKSIRNRLGSLLYGGPLAWFLRHYGHGLDRSFNLITVNEMIAHLDRAYQVLCVDHRIVIDRQLFNDIITHAWAWEAGTNL